MSVHQSHIGARASDGAVEALQSGRDVSSREEWMIDESIEETFPASDATTPVMPGSLAEQHAARGRSSSPPRSLGRLAIYAGVAVSVIVASAFAWKRFRRE